VLGETCSELDLDTSVPTAAHADKTAFSMLGSPEIAAALSSGPHQVILVGIEAHICVLQTTLDLLDKGHKVYVLVDGVSSCNKEEIPIALRRLAREGAQITTSESFLYECMGDAGISEFRSIARLVKESKQSTTRALQALSKI
jgi:nicotinamidase-related amidase